MCSLLIWITRCCHIFKGRNEKSRKETFQWFLESRVLIDIFFMVFHVRSGAQPGRHGGMPPPHFDPKCSSFAPFFKISVASRPLFTILDAKFPKFAPFITNLKNVGHCLHFIQSCPPPHFKILGSRLIIFKTFSLLRVITCECLDQKLRLNQFNFLVFF